MEAITELLRKVLWRTATPRCCAACSASWSVTRVAGIEKAVVVREKEEVKVRAVREEEKVVERSIWRGTASAIAVGTVPTLRGVQVAGRAGTRRSRAPAARRGQAEAGQCWAEAEGALYMKRKL